MHTYNIDTRALTANMFNYHTTHPHSNVLTAILRNTADNLWMLATEGQLCDY